MKTAKEMFEELGYKYTKYGNDIQYYKKFVYSEIIIYFWDFKNEIEISSSKYITITIDINELQAINQQIKELGWNNE